VSRYFAAIAAGDGKAACDRLTEGARGGFEDVLEGPVFTNCEKNIEMLSRRSIHLGRPNVTRVRATGTRATAHVSFRHPDFETDVLLVREGGDWKLAYIAAPPEKLPGPPGFPSEHRPGR
jgi:hypothetical protein